MTFSPAPKLPREKRPRKPLPKATKAIARKSRPKPINRKRRASEFRRAYGSQERVAFVRRLPCVVCVGLMVRPAGESDNAHIIGGGAGRKADARHIAPICRIHHRALHAAGSLSEFYVMFGFKVDLAQAAAETDAAWQKEQAQ